MIVTPIEMDKYIRIGGEKPILVKEAPEEFKKIAREANEESTKLTGEEHFIIEE